MAITSRESDVLGLLGIDAQPGVMLDAILPARFGSTSVNWRK
jgi:hypothetical protein